MRRGRLILPIILLAALVLAAPAWAQNFPPAQQGLATALTNLDGMVPQAIICMEAHEDGRPAEIARTPWEGGAVPADACPPDTDIFQAYTIKAMPGIGRTTTPSAIEAGGND